jgi:hypothetical protein
MLIVEWHQYLIAFSARDCPFLHDADRRMASVLDRIQRAEERAANK